MKRRKPKQRAGTTEAKGIPRTTKQYEAFDSNQQEMWNRVVHGLSLMRSRGLSRQEAAREAGISPRELAILGKEALRKDASGRYRVKRVDDLLRFLVIPDVEGLREVSVRGSEVASTIAQYSNAVQKYLRTGDDAALSRFAGINLKDADGSPIVLITDPAELDLLGSAGVLSFESLYARSS